MTKRLFSIFCVLCCLSTQAQNNLTVRSYTLENGFTVWLNEDHSVPTVFGSVVVKAGAKDSPATGIAHYFEHIMFKGTDKIGTIDYAAEKIYLDSIAAQYDKLANTENADERKHIQQEINRLSIAAAQYAIPNEFNTLTSLFGGSRLNASTSFDFTCYYNSFSPQYMPQWLEINSERLIHPVFRLFQGELETVYEEKNMHEDSYFELAFQYGLDRFFAPHPYRYPIVGTTENLKNPRLSEMADFYEKYYVAGNMGLILCGNFRTEEVLPLIREKFSRIKAGNAPASVSPAPASFQGEENERIKIPLPILKMAAVCWRSVPNGDPDENALKIAIHLLSNSNSTGYIDQLSTAGKLLGGGIEQLQLNETGGLILVVIPKLLFQSYNRALRLILHEIERIKKGDFTEEQLKILKLNLKKEAATQLETMESRAQTMMNVFSQNKKWEEYLKANEQIEALTKKDIVEAANRYFTENRLIFKKKTGHYDKDLVPKPDFQPIVPPHRGESSPYARQLQQEALQMPEQEVRLPDFEKDVHTLSLSPGVTLYTKENPVNDIFRLTFSYHIGTDHNTLLEPMTEYLNILGTDSLSFNEFQNSLREIGATLNFYASPTEVNLVISGFDPYFEQTMTLAAHFMSRVKADSKKLRQQVVNQTKIYRKSLKKEPEDIIDGLYQYVVYGENSSYLRQADMGEIKKGETALLHLFEKVRQTECDIHYSGRIEPQKVAESIKRYFHPENITRKGLLPVTFKARIYDKPIVFFVNNPQATQSIIYSYTPSDHPLDIAFRSSSELFNTYFGKGMSSLLFQEIREFRSYAYYAASGYVRPDFHNRQQSSYLKCILSTQADKTTDALDILDSLLKNMPEKPEKLPFVKQVLRNDIYNSYPSFRKISEQIAAWKRIGYENDANGDIIRRLPEYEMNDISRFYNDNVRHQTTCYIITGNARRIDMEKLKQFGELKEIKTKEIFKE